MRYELEEYKVLVKEERESYFQTPYDLVYKNFISLGYTQKDNVFFLENASSVVENLREKCWNSFLPQEKEFTSKMLRELIDEDSVKDMNPVDAIGKFVAEYPTHMYALNLSNTQSRRSRAGKEFEAIIELLLIGAGIPLDSQGNIGKQTFIEKGLGKLVDVVSPGVVEFAIDKSDTVLISAKTTLRERWQEVPEEMGRTGAREMFLATLDDSISDDVLSALYEANIRVTTTKGIKNRCYSDNRRVLDFEQLLSICNDIKDRWRIDNYTSESKNQIINNMDTQLAKHQDHSFVIDYYNKRKKQFL